MQGSWGVREGPSGKMPPDARPKGRTVITLNNNQVTFYCALQCIRNLLPVSRWLGHGQEVTKNVTALAEE